MISNNLEALQYYVILQFIWGDKFIWFYFVVGANAVEFIINHAEVSIAFVQENKLPAVSSHCNWSYVSRRIKAEGVSSQSAVEEIIDQ